jgi:hypothetical protein
MARGTAVETPSPERAIAGEADGEGHGIAIAGVVGGAALLVAVAVSLYRRRS